MEGLREGYEFFASHSGAYMAAADASQWMDAIEQEIDTLLEDMARFEGSGKKTKILAGDVAEFWHADTFNIDRAVHRSDGPKARALRSNGYATPDVVLEGEGYQTKAYQLKYYRDADASVKAQSATFAEDAARGSKSAQELIESGLVDPNDPVYADMERLVPADQLEEAKRAADRRAATESARRPEQEKRYRATSEHLTSNVEDESGNSSMDLTRDDANRLAEDVKNGDLDPEEWGLMTEQLVQVGDVMRRAAKAGLSAGAVSAALTLAPMLLEAVRSIAEGDDLSLPDIYGAAEDAASAFGKGFVTGAMSAALVDAAGMGILGSGLEGLEPSVVGAAAVIACKALEGSFRVARGEMDAGELVSELGRDAFAATCSLILGGAVQGAIPIPIVGYLVGSFVGSAFGGIAWSAAEGATLALCVKSGVTLFGLVEQNYEVPRSVIEEIGLEVFNYEVFNPDAFEPDGFEPDRFLPDAFEPVSFGIVPLRRGVVGVRRVAYV